MERYIDHVTVIALEKGPAPKPFHAVVPEEAIEETVVLGLDRRRWRAPAGIGDAVRRTPVGLPSEDVDPRTGASWNDIPRTRSMADPIVAAMRPSRGWGAAG